MRPYYANSTVKIYLGDCREVIPQLPEVKLVVTSPPYNVGKAYGTWDDNLPLADYWQFTREWVGACYDVLRPSGRIAVNVADFCNTSLRGEGKGKGIIALAPRYLDIIAESGFSLREMVTWVKTPGKALEEIEQKFCGQDTSWGSWLSPSNPYLRSFCESIIVAHKGSPTLSWRGESDLTKEAFLVWTRNVWLIPSTTHPEHPAPFPPELPRRLMMLYSFIGDLVLDPFCGTGTTLRTAMSNHRPAIGIEIDERYAEIAAESCRQLPLL